MLKPDQARIHEFKVVPSLPTSLEPLLDIAKNLWWSWNPDAIDLFKMVDSDLWKQSNHNPIALLGSTPQDRLEELSDDSAYLDSITRVHARLMAHLESPLWFQKDHKEADDCSIAYFSAEFGLAECLQVYSGGLGVLAGDHLKSASELGVPLVGVGLLYRNGYFQQYLNADGWQQEFYPELDFANLPIRPVHDAESNHLTVTVELPGRSLDIAVWEVKVGRIRLFLLDTNLEQNSEDDRAITSHLYGGDMETRIKQEIVLGIGGRRALSAMAIEPTVHHMNEGHAAFQALEHIRMLIAEHDLSFDEARQAAASGQVFTTHTPVPAGIDRFPPDMIKRYFKDYHEGLGLDMEGLLALGRENVFNANEFFSMAVLAIRTSDAANGVSKLHGEVSREMWGGIWPNVPAEEVPIGHVTNGIHARTWLSPELTHLLDRHLPRRWTTHPNDHSVWDAVDSIPDDELWRIHEYRRRELVRWIRKTQRDQLEQRGATTREMNHASKLFDSHTLTIGFARRFATYKRANMLFRDRDRLMRILTDADRPVQIVVAGKAHPADTQGKELIREIIHFARQAGADTRVVFIENYNMDVARMLVQGVDLWLNTPRRGMEASGTSGMKAAINGVLNCSILDGWWDEAWEKDVGFAIGRGETYANYDYQDQVESEALYDLLEKQVVPMFYDRDADGHPTDWIASMKKCLQSIGPVYNTNRMVQQYAEDFYLPAHKHNVNVMADGLTLAKEHARYVSHLREHWSDISVEDLTAANSKPLGVRKPMTINADVQLGAIHADGVAVQVYFGQLDAQGRIHDGQSVDMEYSKDLGDNLHQYTGQIIAPNSGRHGFAIRVLPGRADLATPFIPGLMTWDHDEPEPVETEPVEITVDA